MRISLHCLISLSLLVCCPASLLTAQQRFTVPRSDGHSTPLMLYPAVGAAAGCAPLAVISHGAGSSEGGYRYLAQGMAQQGFTTLVMGHAESGFNALRNDVRQYGLMHGLDALVADPIAEGDRLLDVDAALKWADGQCQAPFRVLLGHSMGAETVMLEAGAKNIVGVTSPPAGQNRFDAYVALSPEGPGVVFSQNAWNGIRKPFLILTGTKDRSLKGGPKARLAPWANLPGTASHCQWEGVIDGAKHINFAGNGPGSDKVETKVTQTIASFLAGVRNSGCALPAPAVGMTLKAK
jgi:predicted dienelactone hydrolase